MIFFSIGMPSRLAEWCDALTSRLAEYSFGSVERTAVNTLEELAVAVLRTRASHLVACSRQPVVRLQTEIVQGKRPFVVAIGDPRAALRNLSERAGYDVGGAARAVASSCAAMLTLTRAPGALVISDGNATDSIAVAAAIADHFEVPTSRSEIATIVSELCEAGLTPDHDEDSAWWNGLGEREQAIVNGALLPYVSHLVTNAELEPFVWEPELFYIFEDPPTSSLIPAIRPVDITGRARVLVYGPFINLPPGSWSANVILGFSAEAAGMSFTVEVFAGRQLSHTYVEPADGQIIEANLHFVIDNSVDQPVQIRVVSGRPAFDGRLALGYVTMTPQAAIPPATRDRLAAVLRG
ncbi:MAG: hypothetical protein WB611_12805 [Stellaceae bacterium]